MCAIAGGFLISVRGTSRDWEAQDLTPTRTEVANDLDLALMMLGHVDDALRTSEHFLEQRPLSDAAHVRAAAVLTHLGKGKVAVQKLEVVLARDPDDLPALGLMAWILATNPDASVRDGARALKLAQKAQRPGATPNLLVLSSLAAAFAETNQFDKAVAASQEAFTMVRGTTTGQKILDQQASYRAKKPFRDVDRTGHILLLMAMSR
jgi:tetratricopeptide (TPR) repeat protein